MPFNTDPRSEAQPNTNYKRLFELIAAECSEAISALKTNRAIFRGLRLEDQILKTNPRLQKRTSKNTTNYYTLLLDNLPSWKSFPKRSESLICTNCDLRAGNYGSSFLFLPVNGARFGVCPGDDIWEATVNNNPFFQFSAFNDILHECNVLQDSYSSLIRTSLKNKSDISESVEWYDSRFKQYDSVVTTLGKLFLSATTSKQIEKIYDQIYNPQKLGFSVATISKIPEVALSSTDSNEHWTDSSGYLIKMTSGLVLKKPSFFQKYIRPLNKNLFDTILKN